jgi:SAM-dependent methyltransferase
MASNSKEYWDDNFRQKIASGEMHHWDRPDTWHAIAKMIIRLRDFCEVKSLLDLGCGAGYFAKFIKDYKEYSWSMPLIGKDGVYARDRSRVAINWLNQFSSGLHCSVGDAEDTGYPDNYFECVVANELLEHVPDLHAVLKEVKRILGHGGFLVITTPHDGSLGDNLNEHEREFTHDSLFHVLNQYFPYITFGENVRWFREDPNLVSIVAGAKL